MKARQWPVLPRRVQCVGGSVAVRRRKGLVTAEGDRDAWALWDAENRTVWLVPRIPRQLQWRVFYHELFHVALSDSGLENVLPADGVEALCDAYSSSRMVERFG
jgi:hypothetical protein